MSYDKSEPMKAPWFSWSPMSGMEFHKSADEARKRAEDELEAERDEASDGWSDSVDEICWGRAYGGVTETERRPRTDEDWHVTRDAEEVVDYALVDDVPPRSAEEIAALVECERALRALHIKARHLEYLLDIEIGMEADAGTCASDECNDAFSALARLDAARKERGA